MYCNKRSGGISTITYVIQFLGLFHPQEIHSNPRLVTCNRTLLILHLANSLHIFAGPLPKTNIDFWRLVWQERPPTIVMVTNLKEGSKIKCQQYWPETGTNSFGPFQISITDQQTFADYTIRTLQVIVSSIDINICSCCIDVCITDLLCLLYIQWYGILLCPY